MFPHLYLPASEVPESSPTSPCPHVHTSPSPHFRASHVSSHRVPTSPRLRVPTSPSPRVLAFPSPHVPESPRPMSSRPSARVPVPLFSDSPFMPVTAVSLSSHCYRNFCNTAVALQLQEYFPWPWSLASCSLHSKSRTAILKLYATMYMHRPTI